MLRLISRNIPPAFGDGKGWKYIQKETGLTIRHLTWDGLISEIRKHRMAMGLPMPDGWILDVENDVCLSSPCDCDDPENPKPYVSELQKLGRQLWGELHGYSQDPWSPDDAKRWLSEWERRIPNFDYCDCIQSYWKMRTDSPPDFSSSEAFRSWGVLIHNLVNLKLNKPLFSEE